MYTLARRQAIKTPGGGSVQLEGKALGASHDEVVDRLGALFGARSVALIGATDRSQW